LSFQDVWNSIYDTVTGIDWPGAGVVVLWAAVKIAAVIFIARLAIGLGNRLIGEFMERQVKHKTFFGNERRLTTIGGIGKSVLRYGIYFFAGVTVLSLVGIDTSSILVGAGVAGLAVGFGAQNLVRDVLTGFFILFEDQFAVGDYVAIGDKDGIVEEMGLRTTRIRAFGGQAHIIPNGTIELVTNYSRAPMRVLFEVEIAYEEDTARVIEFVQGILDRFAAESDVVTEGPRVLGVSQLGASGVALMVWAKVKPMEQWAVERELKLRIKRAFDEAGVEIPYPRRVYISGGTLNEPIRPNVSQAQGDEPDTGEASAGSGGDEPAGAADAGSDRKGEAAAEGG